MIICLLYNWIIKSIVGLKNIIKSTKFYINRKSYDMSIRYLKINVLWTFEKQVNFDVVIIYQLVDVHLLTFQILITPTNEWILMWLFITYLYIINKTYFAQVPLKVFNNHPTFCVTNFCPCFWLNECFLIFLNKLGLKINEQFWRTKSKIWKFCTDNKLIFI